LKSTWSCNQANVILHSIIRIGATNGYVMHALLAFSAMHVAHLTDCPLVGNIAYEHRGIALKGLQEAISTFSRETSDAVLAASLVLSWQATDWYVQTYVLKHMTNAQANHYFSPTGVAGPN
jgi:hypothetical protein